MNVIRRADGDGVDALAHLVEQLAIIDELLGLGIEGRRLGQTLLIDVADGNDIAVPRGLRGITAALAVDADAGETDLLVGRLPFFISLRGAGDPEADPGQGTGL